MGLITPVSPPASLAVVSPLKIFTIKILTRNLFFHQSCLRVKRHRCLHSPLERSRRGLREEETDKRGGGGTGTGLESG